MEGPIEGLDHLFGLTDPQQAVIDEHAGELIADCLVDEGGGDGRVDSTGQAADDLAIADLGPDVIDRPLDDRDVGPGRAGAGRFVQEVLEDLLTSRRVGHFGMELDAVEPAGRVLHRRHR